MWDAVNANDGQLVQYLLMNGINPNDKEPGRPTTALLEAHILGRNEIVKIFQCHFKEEAKPPSNELVVEVLKVSVSDIVSNTVIDKYSIYEQVNIQFSFNLNMKRFPRIWRRGWKKFSWQQNMECTREGMEYVRS